MSNSTEPANTTSAAEAPKKKSKKMMLIIIVLVLAAGGAGGYFFFLRGNTASAKAKTEKNKKGHSDEKSEENEEAHGKTKGEAKGGEKDEKSADVAMPDDSDVKLVTELQPFIVNLADKDGARYLRLTISLGLAAGEGEEKPDTIFTTRVRNAMLAVLTSKTSEEILSAEGKIALRKELLKAAQTASEEPKVAAIYITDFIVQL